MTVIADSMVTRTVNGTISRRYTIYGQKLAFSGQPSFLLRVQELTSNRLVLALEGVL